jgi:LysR family transcriptional regulator AphB
VRLEFVLNDARADLLGEGIDVAIRGGKDIEPQLIARRIGSSSAGLVASSAYLAKRGQPATPAALAQHDCIGTTSRPDGAMSWRLDGPDGEVHIAVRGRFGANSAHARLQGALAGLGIALLPHIMTNGPVQAGRLQVVLPGYGTDGAGLYLAYLSRRQLPLALSRFIDFMAPNLAAQGIVDG